MTVESTSSASRAPASLCVLLRRVVDYAGLFPPASLSMASAVTEYAQQRRGDDAWALGRFVLPAARLDEFSDVAAAWLPQSSAESWALSALLGTDVEEDVARIEAFNARHSDARRGAVLVDTVELKTHTERDIGRAAEVLDGRFDTFMEIPVADDPVELVDAISRTRAKAKIRTGGVAADAFPSGAQVVRFIGRCVQRDVAFKATAGLHHAWRAEYHLTYAAEAPIGTMFGFLNVLLATAAVHAGLAERDVVALVEERDPAAVRLDRDGVRWREHTLSLDVLARARNSLMSFGSCSFREPVEELRAQGLL